MKSNKVLKLVDILGNVKTYADQEVTIEAFLIYEIGGHSWRKEANAVLSATQNKSDPIFYTDMTEHQASSIMSDYSSQSKIDNSTRSTPVIITGTVEYYNDQIQLVKISQIEAKLAIFGDEVFDYFQETPNYTPWYHQLIQLTYSEEHQRYTSYICTQKMQQGTQLTSDVILSKPREYTKLLGKYITVKGKMGDPVSYNDEQESYYPLLTDILKTPHGNKAVVATEPLSWFSEFIGCCVSRRSGGTKKPDVNFILTGKLWRNYAHEKTINAMYKQLPVSMRPEDGAFCLNIEDIRSATVIQIHPVFPILYNQGES